MNNVDILDCTLRDGGYANQWEFGEHNIKRIINNLIESKIDIIECGFLTDQKKRNQDTSLYDSIGKISEYLPMNRSESMTVCMINFGGYNIDELPICSGDSVDGIRLAFHKKDINKALKVSEKIINKGYKLFMQPMVSVSYSDSEFIELINKSNNIKPYAFYIVDSFGVMKRNDLMRLFYLVDHNLSSEISVGYHSHNNIQMAYSNAQALVDLKTKRRIIIDSSVFGMGRGAGNLNTELFIEYLNEKSEPKYQIKPLLRIIDQVLNPIYASSFWGYSLPHYVSAMNNCHPNYASYLDDKNTLTIENISEILSNLEDSKRNNFDKDYVEKLYIEYQDRAIADEKAKQKLITQLDDKNVIIIAPGSSINEEKEKIFNEINKNNSICISINFKPEQFKCDYIFVSNLRRYEDLKNIQDTKIIKTSNIKNVNSDEMIVNYSDLMNNIEAVEDNSGMMLIKLLIDIGVKRVMLAGFDGYSHDIYDNFADKKLAFIKSASVMDAMNKGMEQVLNQFSDIIDVQFITTPKYVKIRREE